MAPTCEPITHQQLTVVPANEASCDDGSGSTPAEALAERGHSISRLTPSGQRQPTC